ncbi:MAG: hypothetical protein IPG55_07685 [Saprospiraceae bacterium]|nr:hypothetical protein [Candidatus Defluviibacterium haderslevense]
MKNKLLVIIYLLSFNTYGQQNLVQYTDSILKLVYHDSIISGDQEDAQLGKLDSIISLNCFIKDSNLEERLNKYIEFINSIGELSLYDYRFFPFESRFYYTAQNYHKLQLLSNIPYNQIPDTLSQNGNLELLYYHEAIRDTHFLMNLFRVTQSYDNKIFAYGSLLTLDSIQFQEFYNNHFSYIKNDTNLFLQTVVYSKKYGKPFPFPDLAKDIFVLYIDTTNRVNKLNYEYYFGIGLNPNIILMDEEYEANRPQREQFEREKEEANRILEEEYMNVRDSLNWISLKTKVPQYFNAIGDTTLWDDNGDYPMWTGDDGMRFDTFSTEEIFNRLAQINFVALYDTIKNEGDLNASATAIHMRKMLQIIGDRNIYRGYIPSSSQMLLLNQLIDLYTEYLMQDTLECMSRESILQMQRLWNLAEYKYIDWPILNNEFLNFQFVNAVRIHATESLILAMIGRADAYELAGNHDLAYRYIKPLMSIYEAKFIENIGYAMPARRPFRTLEDSNRWCFDYIIPALQRYKFID